MCKSNPFDPIPWKTTHKHRLIFAISYASQLCNLIMAIVPDAPRIQLKASVSLIGPTVQMSVQGIRMNIETSYLYAVNVSTTLFS